MTYSNRLKSTVLTATLFVGSFSLANGVSPNSAIFSNDRNHQNHIECDEIEVKLDITHTTENQPNGKIVMNFKKSNTSYTSFVLAGEQKNNLLDVKDNEINDLSKGEYNLYIQDKNGCTKHIKFKIN
jgi:hypothetical protein